MPKQLKILTNPNPILRKKSVALDLENINWTELKPLLLDMEETMLKKDGAGLAAPQIGQNIRLVVIRYDDQTIWMINPLITKKSWAKEIEEEGCLSVLNSKGEIIYAPVERHKKINCIYFNEKGQKQKITAQKLIARVIQHELDHLDGVLFIDRIVKNKS